VVKLGKIPGVGSLRATTVLCFEYDSEELTSSRLVRLVVNGNTNDSTW